ncbi:ribonuclease R [Murdochiella vaginalis]|uniref:ribonuclease R n=1 Tax=Murdochiella vaginalis TaxID=1852373 RepID=UPI0008FEAC72|nr:ribonuclease R [Murdochiella vaginalis]
MELREFLLSYFSGAQYEPLRTKELADRFGLEGEARIAFYNTIDAMLEEEVIRMSKRGKIKAYAIPVDKTDSTRQKTRTQRKGAASTETEGMKESFMPDPVQTAPEHVEAQKIAEPEQQHDVKPVAAAKSKSSSDEQQNPLIGKLTGNAKGFAFFVSQVEGQPDVFISPDDLNGAIHGDRVRIKILEKADPATGRNSNGRVVSILTRNTDPIVGLYEKRSGLGYVLPDKKNFFSDIPVSDADAMGAQDGDKVILRLLDVEKNGGNPAGRIIENLGPADAKGVDITAVARQFELPYVFSQETKEEAEALPEEVDKREFRGRRDLRNIFTVTIDGADAKDFDDAISLEKRGKYYILYVHIADVSHYVKPGSAIDRDAYERGNSVYLLDRVIPMLPEKLSNGLCSLNPGVERLAMTTQMTLDEEGNVVDHQFYPSVICSDHRLIYKDVSDYLEKGTRFTEEEALFTHLDTMATLYALLAKKRVERGTLDFDFPETDVILDDDGLAVDVRLADRRIANRIIEEFMILNNVIVGTTFFHKKLPFIYRVHAEPKEEDIERLNTALMAFHYEPIEAEPEPSRIRAILEQAKGKKEEGILNMLVLQSMSKAVYSPKPTMHYGLAEEHYSHFTSPIRRYSDLMAHRLLKALLAGTPKTDEAVKKDLFVRCEHISLTEQKAEEAERDVVEMKCAEYMQRFIGEEFVGQITSLTNFGVFVRLPNTVEGLAHFRDMTDDYYSYDEERMVVRGENNHRELRYGDEVRVLVAAANPLLREIDFHLPDFVQEDGRRNKPSAGECTTNLRGARPSHSFRRRNDERPKNFKGAKTSRANRPRKEGLRRRRRSLSGRTGRRG